MARTYTNRLTTYYTDEESPFYDRFKAMCSEIGVSISSRLRLLINRDMEEYQNRHNPYYKKGDRPASMPSTLPEIIRAAGHDNESPEDVLVNCGMERVRVYEIFAESEAGSIPYLSPSESGVIRGLIYSTFGNTKILDNDEDTDTDTTNSSSPPVVRSERSPTEGIGSNR